MKHLQSLPNRRKMLCKSRSKVPKRPRKPNDHKTPAHRTSHPSVHVISTPQPQPSIYTCTYIYIYIHRHTYTCIHTHTEPYAPNPKPPHRKPSNSKESPWRAGRAPPQAVSRPRKTPGCGARVLKASSHARYGLRSMCMANSKGMDPM